MYYHTRNKVRPLCFQGENKDGELFRFVVTARHCVSWDTTGQVVAVDKIRVWLGSHAQEVGQVGGGGGATISF